MPSESHLTNSSDSFSSNSINSTVESDSSKIFNLKKTQTDSSNNSNHFNSISNNSGAGTNDFFGNDKVEVTRLLIQSLYDIGYPSIASQLEECSHIKIESEDVTKLKKAVLDGNWPLVEEVIAILPLRDNVDKNELKLLLKKQQFLEAIEAGHNAKALKILRNDISRLNCDKKAFHFLSNLMITSSPEELRKKANWDGAKGESRKDLLRDFQNYISTTVMLPENRLSIILDQAKDYQALRCKFYNKFAPHSLFYDLTDSRDYFPTINTHTLLDHGDEVWFLQFSNNGKYLASASKDKTVNIWEVEDFTRIKKLDLKHINIIKPRSDGISHLSWSPDDSCLVICGPNDAVTLWSTEDWEQLFFSDAHDDHVSGSAWFPDSESFVTSSLDQSIIRWNKKGESLFKWQGKRIHGVAITPDGKTMVSICTEKQIHVYDLESNLIIKSLHINNLLTSVNVSKDSRYALVNIAPNEIHIWDIKEFKLVQKYIGQQQPRYIIKSCFAGNNEEYIVSGSEDEKVYIWNRNRPSIIDKLSGHEGPVNCTAWTPFNGGMLASCGDDATVRIWQPETIVDEEN